jgi:hypothetical protein
MGALIEGVLEFIGDLTEAAFGHRRPRSSVAQMSLGIGILLIIATAFVIWPNWGDFSTPPSN